MSVKWLVVAAGLGCLALAQITSGKESSAADLAAGADTVATVKAGFGSKIRHGIGSIGVVFVDKIVRDMSVTTQQRLGELKPALKGKRGADGDRARKAANTAAQ